jgi:glutathione S-transferase
MASIKPITLYGHVGGPNPWKVAFVLEELKVPYTQNILDYTKLKKAPYVNVNPNGRVPAIEDPNTGITLWESGAILEYLVDTYDKDNRISFPVGTKEYYFAKQWLHFQMSGQGPYFGQGVWFHLFHSEQVESAKERYVQEIKRVSAVLDGQLSNREWLVGNKFSYVDIAFVPWYEALHGIGFMNGKVDFPKEFPHLIAWLERVKSHQAISKVIKEWSDMKAASK